MIMDYDQTLAYLYEKTPAFHIVGADAYKVGLERSFALDDALDFPHKRYNTIHIAGTNGKGSVAHLLAAILRSSGYKVGLYTSPHLVDFRERIRYNGAMIPKLFVVEFVKKNQKLIKKIEPSFFELTTMMAFYYFRHKKVNFAIIETGMGGRLDTTNIITPVLSIITSISFDHRQYLGNTLAEIATEKAGIIKRFVPTIIGEGMPEEANEVFRSVAAEKSSILSFASEKKVLASAAMRQDFSWDFETLDYTHFHDELKGLSQKYNAATVLEALRILSELGFGVRKTAINKGFKDVCELTGLMGRWEEIGSNPKVICDIGHNEGAWKINSAMLENESKNHDTLHVIIGFSSDKEIDTLLSYLPERAVYYFTNSSGPRALPAEQLAEKAKLQGLYGVVFKTVKEAVYNAVEQAAKKDMIFIGGSAFVVGEAYPLFSKKQFIN
jgi:dihydrofolate synthase/folylpolyglutamate synthase